MKFMQIFRSPRFRKAGSINRKPPLFSVNSISSSQSWNYKALGAAILLSLTGMQSASALTVAQENALPGDSSWFGFHVIGSYAIDNPRWMDGYADKDSVNVGGTINLFVHADPVRNPTYTIKVYRLGWYNGAGGRLMFTSPSRTSQAQITPAPDTFGNVACNWTNPYTLTIGPDWTSGIYVATIVGNDRQEGKYIPFTVRNDSSTSPYLFQASTTTWHAYNNWGGKSLYGYNSTGLDPARKISFNRPYENAGGLGTLLNAEINMLYFLEKEGYDVSYQANSDTHANGSSLLNHKAFLSVGHDEYWSKAMRDNVENARAHGVGIGFFGANDVYWQIRMEDNNRTIVGFKDNSPNEDPLAIDADASNDFLITSRWRNGEPGAFRKGANKPENALVGIMYAFGPKGNFTLNSNIISAQADPNKPGFAPPKHWAFANSKVQVGEVFPGLLGYEADRRFDNGQEPAGLEVLAASPVSLGVVDHDSPASANYDPNNPKSHASVYYKNCTVAPCLNSVSTVFAAGSLQWVWGLNTSFKYPYIDPIASVQVITRNVLARMINPPAPAAALATSNADLLANPGATKQIASATSKEEEATKFAPNIIPLIKKEQDDDKAKIKKWKQDNKQKDDNGNKKDIEV